MNGRGIQSEVLVSLALVMVTAIALLTIIFFEAHSNQLDRLGPLLGRALAAEGESSTVVYGDAVSTATWYRVDPTRTDEPHKMTGERLDEAALDLARRARAAERPLLAAGRPWEPIHFAMPMRGPTPGIVAVAVLPPSIEGRLVLGLMVIDGCIFTLLGAYLLRRRVVSPLRKLAETARAIEESGPGPRVAVEGVREAVEVGEAMSDMSEALSRRNTDLEKAISDLRGANTSLRRAREGLDRSERLAAVGQLAAGVAHEVGNPMGAVLAFLDMAQRDESLSESSRTYISRAVEQGLRVRKILGQLLDFSRPPRTSRTSFDLGAVAEQAVGLVTAQSRYDGLSFEIVREEGDPIVVADESIAAQILLNLVLNAADAAGVASEPRVRVSVILEGRRAGDGVVCHVEDNGPGVEAEDRSRIFDPFFTTKPPGEGTGLGLANALRLAEDLGGGLRCDRSEDLGGADFVLELPRPE
jgi:C4-dicarboxylate-specific signal transduction histidine kinase